MTIEEALKGVSDCIGRYAFEDIIFKVNGVETSIKWYGFKPTMLDSLIKSFE